MNKTEIQEGLGELADRAERDHEVQMARSDLYKIAKYAIKLHDMLKGVSEEQGLEGWVQSKITKSADYIGSVYHHLDYEEATGELGEEVAEGKFKSDAHRKAVHAAKASGKRSKKKLRKTESEYKDTLHAKLAEKKATEQAVTTKKISAKNIKAKNISPNKGGN
jgi:chromosome condensin MukBEF ATPase and DNA-binding subunit MukB